MSGTNESVIKQQGDLITELDAKIEKLNTVLNNVISLTENERDTARAENKVLKTDYGLLEISRDHERTLRISCEQALLERDANLEKLQAEVESYKKLAVPHVVHNRMKAEKKALRDAAKKYLIHAGHSAKCWNWRGQDMHITERSCICGHDGLSEVLKKIEKGRANG